MYLSLFEIFQLIFLQEQSDFRTTPKRWTLGVASDGEGATSRRAPDVLLIVIVFRDDLDFFGNEVGTVETNTELTWMSASDVEGGREGEGEGSVPIMEMSAPDIAASMNCFVPDFAIVPRLLMRSAFVMPMPVSRMERMPCSLSGVMRM